MADQLPTPPPPPPPQRPFTPHFPFLQGVLGPPPSSQANLVFDARPPPSVQHSAASSSTAGSQFSQSWYPNSGASHHVTSDQQNIHHMQPFEGTDNLCVGNGQGLPISGIGSFLLSQFCPKSSLILKNLLFVPTITKNLVTVSQFARDNRVFFEFHPHMCLVKSQDSSEVLLQGTVGSDGLYKFQDFKLSHLHSAPVSSPSSSDSESLVTSSSCNKPTSHNVCKIDS